MFFEILLAILLGCAFGIFTGLIPGIHINLISLIILTSSVVLLNHVSLIFLGVFIIAMAITHTFLDSIPSIYLGAPDEAQALNVLPGHRLLMRGEGHNAITCTVIGSVGCLLLGLALFPIFITSMKFVYPIVKSYIGYALIVIMAFMILKEKGWKKKFNSLVMFLMAGVLGLIVLNISTMEQPLFPLLSGLFGISLLSVSLLQKTKIPKQDFNIPLKIKKSAIAKATTASTFMGFIAAFLPGFGSSQAAIVAQQITGDLGDEGFLALVGGINTANMLISIGTLYALSRARNGAVLVINKLLNGINLETLLIFLASVLIVAAIATFLTLKISKIFCRFILKVNYTFLISFIIIFITALSVYFDNWIGLIVLVTSTAVGIIASELGIGKNHLMGCLILPVILFFVL